MKHWLTNVLLETGEYLKENDTVGTKVELFTLKLQMASFRKLYPQQTQSILKTKSQI